MLLISHASLAAATTNVTRNDEVKACEEKYGDENSECLGDIEDKSTEALNKAYTNKLKGMESFDYTEWWIGDEDRKKQMIEAFRKNQRDWLTYRDGYCDVATTSAQGTHFLGAASVGCNINMNKRRIREMEMINVTGGQ